MTRTRPSLRGTSRADAALVLALVGVLVLGLVMSALVPSLLADHVLVLEAFQGGVLALVVGGADARVHAAPLLGVVLAPLVGVLVYDVVFWCSGRRWGTRLLRGLDRRRSAGPGEHPVLELVRRRGLLILAVAYYQPVPNPVLYAACGASGMGLGTFLLGDVVGTLLWEALLLPLGWAFGRRAVDTVQAVDDHALLVTVVVVVAVVLGRAVRGRSRPRPPADPA